MPRRRGSRFDVRRTLRRSLRTQGEPFDRAWRDRRVRGRPLVLILDVSGSMSPYSRALVQFGYAAMAAGRRVEVFCFGTRLTRVTRMLRTKDPDRALHEIGRGGGRLGGRDADRRVAEVAAGRVEPARGAAGRGRRAVLGRVGARRPGAAAGADGAAGAAGAQGGLGEPAEGIATVRAAGARDGGGAARVDVFLSGHNLESLSELSRSLAG